MSLISIETENCNLCGICVERCATNFHEIEDEITTTAREDTCALCGHCVALCPTDVIVHHKMEMSNFLPLDRKLKFDPDQFEEFVRGRRSIRSYKKRKIPHHVLARLVELCRYAPTGGNKQDVEILIIEDAQRNARISKLTAAFIADLYPPPKQEGDTPVPPPRPDPIFYQAPAVMIFHQPKNSGKTDSVIAAQTVVLAAMTLELGSCYIGFLEYAWQNSAEVRQEVNLPDDHSMGSVLILGYPKQTYLRSVDRFPMNVRWE